MSLIESRASGSTFMEISGSEMKIIPALVPNNIVLSHFIKACESIFNEQLLLENTLKKLGAIRDTLLPKLMSGAIRVPIEMP